MSFTTSRMLFESFVSPHSVELEALGPILGQVVVALSPFVEMHPKVVSEIFNFLIIDSR